MTTHQDCENARRKRDAAARSCALQALTGNTARAKADAEEFVTFDLEMDRICGELDG